MFFSVIIDFTCPQINGIEEDYYESVAKSSRKVNENFRRLRLDGRSLHNILVSESVLPTDITMVRLPLLRFNQCPVHLEWNIQNNDSVIFLITPFIKHVYSILEKHKNGQWDFPLHIRGSIGIGKSAAIYTCCYALQSRQEDKIFVTYIPCCQNWMVNGRESYKYFLTELVQTFYSLDDIKPPDDNPDIKSVVGWATYVQDVIKKYPTDLSLFYYILIDMVSAIEDAIISKELYWVVVFDNHNALYQNTAYKDKPFIIINDLSSFFHHNPKHGMLVLSSSNNNEFYNLGNAFKHEDVDSKGESELKFQAEHLQSFLVATNKAQYFKYPLSEAVKIIMQCTEGIPIEVLTFFTSKRLTNLGSDPVTDLQEFLRSRYDELGDLMFDFELSRLVQKSYLVTLAKVIMKIPCDNGEYLRFDRRFVRREIIIDCASQLFLLQPVSELVNRVFKKRFDSIDEDEYDKYIFRVSQDINLVLSACYHHVENYIIHKLTHYEQCKLRLKWSDKNGLNYYGDISYSTKLSVTHFKGTSIPEVAFKRKATLYYPNSDKYPAVDFFLFLPGPSKENDILYAIQVTGSSDPNQHMLNDMKNFHPEPLVHSKYRKNVVPEEQEKWAKYCNIPTENVKIVWFLKNEPSPCNEQKRLYLLWNDIEMKNLCKYLTLF